jgi:hypothetical protein
MAVRAELKVRGRPGTLADPSGGTLELLVISIISCPRRRKPSRSSAESIPMDGHRSLAQIWQHSREADQLLSHAADGPERHGLLRLRALALAAQDDPGAEMCFLGD